MKKVVCIGGGNGAAQILLGLKQFRDIEPTGIIAVTDSGRSTGKARIAADIPAPGDIRNALVSLSSADPFLKELFQFRFRSPKLTDLDGMAFGNLFIAALSQMLGSFEEAVSKTADFLEVKGSIVPIMLANTHIACEREDKTFDYEDVNVRAIGKSPIKRLFLQHAEVDAHPKAIQAILDADVVTIGPGSLYTTVIACLLTPGIPEALLQTKAKIVYVMNTTTQPGQTDSYSLSKHLEKLTSYLSPQTVDYVLINTQIPEYEQIEKLKEDGLVYLPFTEKEKEDIEKQKVAILEGDVIEQFDANRSLWNKQDTICHDATKVATLLYNTFFPTNT